MTRRIFCGCTVFLWLSSALVAGAGAQPADASDKGKTDCPLPVEIPEWGRARKVGDIDAARLERRYSSKIVAARESRWEIPPGTAGFTCLDLGDPAAARALFERLKVSIGPERIILLKDRFVILAYQRMERYLRDAAAKVKADDQFGPGQASRELDLPDAVFPERGNLMRNASEFSTSAFEDQEGGTPLVAVKRLMWQKGGSVWLEAIFLVPGKGVKMSDFLEKSLRFRRKANGHVVDFESPAFLVEVIGSKPELVDGLASKIALLHPEWKRHSDEGMGQPGKGTP